jgi:type VI secretion system protein
VNTGTAVLFLYRLRLLIVSVAMLVVACPGLSGCGLFSKNDNTPAKTKLKSVSVMTMPDANQTTATALDVVFVYDVSVVTMLPKDAVAWFESRDALNANLWRYLDIVSVEIPPAYLLTPLKLPKRHGEALKVVSYANYLAAPGCAPVDLTELVHAELTLNAKTVTFAEAPTGK